MSEQSSPNCQELSREFDNKELQGSYCREDRRRKEREKIQSDVTENVAENSFPKISEYSCNQCEEKFKTEKGLNINIGRIHKECLLTIGCSIYKYIYQAAFDHKKVMAKLLFSPKCL